MKRLFIISMVLSVCMGTMAQTKSLFDSDWQFTRNGKTINVNLPHDWDIYEAPDPATGATKEGGGWYPAGKGEYKKQFNVESGEWKNKRVMLHFEGVYQKAEVFVNGQKVVSPTGTERTVAMWTSRAIGNPSASTARCCGKRHTMESFLPYYPLL